MLLDIQKFEDYLLQIQQVALRIRGNQDSFDEIKQIIDHEKEETNNSETYSDFFLGEEAFFSGHYEHALKHYLQAKDVPHYKFFCYRASAYVSKARYDYKKAQLFAEKSLAIYPYDVSCLTLLAELLDPSAQSEQLREISQTLKKLEEGEISSYEVKEYNNESPDEECCNEDAPCETNSPWTQKTESYLTNIGTHAHNIPAQAIAIEDLQRLAQRNTIQEIDSTQNFSSSYSVGDELSERIQKFQKVQSDNLNQYLEQYRRRTPIADNCLFILQGWSQERIPLRSPSLSDLLLTEHSRKMTGGFFLRWNGKGIVLNPGTNFLENFHQQGLHLKDIDYVIVTGNNPNTYADIKEIYDLNYQLNKVNPELQIINYYLCQNSYQALSPILKPNYKQERNSVHCLELYLDSPDVEKAELCEGIVLNYFPITMQENYLQHSSNKEDRNYKSPAIGIRFELKNPLASDKTNLRVAYVSGAAWSPLLAHHLGSCDLLITGFGSTNANDYSKIKYNEDCLGYYGTYSLLEEVNPNVLLCSEFTGNEGDIRIEVIKKMRKEYLASGSHKRVPVILPADSKLFLDLKTLNVRCTVSNTLIDPNQIKIARTTESFGNLQFLSPKCSL